MQPVNLDDGTVLLSAPTPADVDAITEACQDRDVQAWTTVPSPYSRADAEGFIDTWVVAGWREGRHATWAIREEGELVGMVGLAMHPPGSAEIGYWMAPRGRGRGLLHRAVLLVLAWAFDDPDGPGLDQVEWHAFAGTGRHGGWRGGWVSGSRRPCGWAQRNARPDGTTGAGRC